VSVLAVVKRKFKSRGQIENYCGVMTKSPPAANRFYTPYYSIISSLLFRITFRYEGFNHRLIIVDSRDGPSMYVNFAQSVQIIFSILVGMVSCRQIGITKTHKFSGPEYKVGYVVNRVLSVFVYPADSYSLIRSGSPE